MNPETETRSQYKIWRCKKGRSMKRWLTDRQVATYKIAYPHWRWQKVQVENRSYQASIQQAQQYGSRSKVYSEEFSEVVSNRERLRDKSQATISYDDILDVQLALKKGI